MEHRDRIIQAENGKVFLPVSVIDGPNGGGKSNVLEALCQYRLDRAKEDFFIASKADSEIQLNHAHDFVSVVEAYLDNKLNN